MEVERNVDASYSRNAATAINLFFGINNKRPLSINMLPARINLGICWRQILPILDEHPQDRELYIGWDYLEEKLVVAEITEGMTRAEYLEENPKQLYMEERYRAPKIMGALSHHSHHINFHSHTVNPDDEKLPKERHKRIVSNTPRSTVEDLLDFVTDPIEYASIIIEAALLKHQGVGRAVVFLKTDQTSLDNPNVNFKHRRLSVIINMYREQLLGLHPSDKCNIPCFSRKNITDMIKILQTDDHWCNFAKIAIYRGLVSKNAKQEAFALRYDVFYQKLISAKEIRGERRLLSF